MKKLITIIMLFLCFAMNAQSHHRNRESKSKEGLFVFASGALLSVISITVPDGSEWTYTNNGQFATKTYKPFYKNTPRVMMLGVGVTLSISGLIYQIKK